jgi:hypothetical protein
MGLKSFISPLFIYLIPLVCQQYSSLEADYRRVRAGTTEPSDIAKSESKGGHGGGNAALPRVATLPNDIYYKPEVFSKECEGWLMMSIYQSNKNREITGVYTKEGKLIIFPIASHDLTHSYWHREYRINGRTVLTFGYDDSGKLLTKIFNANGTVDVYAVSYMIHTHLGIAGCDAPSPTNTYNREGDRFVASLYPTVKHFVLGCTKFIEFDGGTLTNKRPLPDPNDCK